jgi:hypothetical protein
MLRGTLAVCEFESFTCTVKVLVPFPVGVPEITPELESRSRPAGRLPETIDHVYGVAPPEAVNVALYATPCVAVGKDVVVIEGGGGGGGLPLDAPDSCTMNVSIRVEQPNKVSDPRVPSQ